MIRTPSTQAGGLFLMLSIIIGSMWGAVAGRAMVGVLGGFGVGVAIAVAIWLMDRSRVR